MEKYSQKKAAELSSFGVVVWGESDARLEH